MGRAVVDARADVLLLQRGHEGIAVQAHLLGMDAQHDEVEAVAMVGIAGRRQHHLVQVLHQVEVAVEEHAPPGVEAIQLVDLVEPHGGLQVHAEIFQIADQTGMAAGLVGAAHDAEGHHHLAPPILVPL